MAKNKYFDRKTIRDIDLSNQTVLVRADYNVPMSQTERVKGGKIDNDFRIRASLPTLKYLIKHGCRVVICSHLSRPDGKPVASLSLEPVAQHLSKLLDKKVEFIPNCVGDKAYQRMKRMPAHSVVLLENLRFHSQEEANDPKFARNLAKASQARYFVQDGFGVVHRAHASTSAITRELPSMAGLLLEKEVSKIEAAMADPERPFVALLGGAKISDKLVLIERFIDKADQILVGGAMANTFLQYYGINIGKSKWEDGLGSEIQKIAKLVAAKEKQIYSGDSAMTNCVHAGPQPCLLCSRFLVLPGDVAVGKSIDAHTKRASIGLRSIKPDDMILDIGDKTAHHYASLLTGARTIIWNGTMGMAELPAFAYGSNILARQIHSQHEQSTTIIGGGDTSDYILKWNHGRIGGFSHISTGGGASLELMAGLPLPGVTALMSA